MIVSERACEWHADGRVGYCGDSKPTARRCNCDNFGRGYILARDLQLETSIEKPRLFWLIFDATPMPK
ncbi:hypothetical protein FTUN_8762 [Frigoriglobus tundricola]|uniref:Uncharacterized protein n=1 Tax=Frigoriglobus tundricola TaxID=2774151 RepID=A0A6M5Z7D7_9BACT|nr:hypothetical protein FTUN_8762 [Frigoriglobus tundricola]